MRLLVIMQGVPGSGKSTIAKHLAGNFGEICSTDSFFRDQFGKYRFDRSKLKENHERCFKEVEHFMENETPLIVLDNTNIKQYHIDPYLELTRRYGYTPVVIRANGRYPNIHDVPESTVERMRAEMEGLKVG